MDFIERWFGISPDGGDGTTEALYVLAVIAVLVVAFARPLIRRLARKRRL
jgi:hypothetical protein